MVKVAELSCGRIICGIIIDDTIAFRDDIIWQHLFFIQTLIDPNGNKGIRFSPVAAFGDFNQQIRIDEKDITYMYDPNPKFIQSYRRNVEKVKEAQGDIIVASPADVPKGNIKLV